jgi:hypothetical protein
MNVKFEKFFYEVLQGFLTGVCLCALLYVIVIMIGCTTAPTVTAPAQPKYELTLSGTVDGVSFQGVAVGSSSTSHRMVVQSAVAVDYFTVQSCHRSLQFNNVITEPWYTWITGTNTQGFSWNYVEAPTIEDTGDCILRFCAFSKTIGAPPSACAIVDFKSDRYQLPSENICNGADGVATGTSICHTQVGLLERVRFQGPVVIAPQVMDPSGKSAPYWISGQCVGKFIDAANTLFEYQMPSSECSIVFMEVAKPHRRAKLTAIPYTQSLYYGGS